VKDFKSLVVDAYSKAARESETIAKHGGLILDHELGGEAIAKARRQGIPVAQPVEIPGSKPLQLYEDHFFEVVQRRPAFIKCLVHGGPQESAALYEQQNRTLEQLFWTCEREGVPFTPELITPEGPRRAELTARWMQDLTARGIQPAYWKLQGFDEAAEAAEVARACGPKSRIIMLGKSAPREVLARHMASTRGLDAFVGFAVGRTIFSEAFSAHLQHAPAQLTIGTIADGYLDVMNLWSSARRGR
jgi:5-dehydro-2-deoxygluconokinase